jgi:hypothetical protein
VRSANIVVAISNKVARSLGQKTVSERALASELGVNIDTIRSWKNKTALSGHQIANLVASVKKSAEKGLLQRSIRTIVEFFQIETAKSQGGNHQEIFSTWSEDGNSHQYLRGLREELERCNGIYIFYDSSGRAIYVGKATKTLWQELKNAFNRKRGDVQSIYRVKHPQKNYNFKSSEEKSRQIRRLSVPIFELAAYFSAYEVPNDLINKLEALMVRAFANDLLNVRMERLAPPVKSPRAFQIKRRPKRNNLLPVARKL